MGSFKALTLAGVLAAGVIHTASAADLLPPPPVLDAPLRGSMSDASGWYLRGDVGVGPAGKVSADQTFAPKFVVPNLRMVSHNLGDQTLAGVGVGYKFNNWFRSDFTAEYRTGASWTAHSKYDCGGGSCPDVYTAKINEYQFMVNGYADLGTWNGLTPYIGAGVGTAVHGFKSLVDIDPQNGGYGFAKDKYSWALAWSLMAGVAYDVTANTKLTIGYRYTDMGTATSGHIVCQNTPFCGFEQHKVRVTSHDLRLGMRWMLGETSPAIIPVSAPLVRKY